MHKIIYILIIIIFTSIVPCSANPTLEKISQTDWTIFAECTSNSTIKIDDYSLVINKYELRNNSENIYEITNASQLNNTNDKKILSTIKHEYITEETKLKLAFSMICPFLLLWESPRLIKDTLTIPIKKLKEKDYKRLANKYTKTIIGKKLKKNDKISIYTLQNQEEAKKEYILTLKNTKNNEEITLTPITENTKFNKKISKIDRLDENTNLCKYIKN